ncbi:hypothetical protein QH637_02805 [Heyndrickxia coagulans]
MKNWILGFSTALLLLFIFGYFSYKYVLNLTYDIIEKGLDSANFQTNEKESNYLFKDLKGDGRSHPLSEKFKTKSQVMKRYPFLYSYFKETPNVNWKSIENDWAVIQNAINSAGINGYIKIPKATVGYRINEPFIIKQGQTIVFSPNTKLFDFNKNDYAIKIIGGSNFPGTAITNISISNVNIVGSSFSQGAIKMQNCYLINLYNIKVDNYNKNLANGIYLQDFFQISLNSIQINRVKNGNGIHVDAVNGNSGQLNIMNSIIQRSKNALFVIGSHNLVDGVNFWGGAIGNNYSKGVRIEKNVYNVNFTGSHFENQDGKNGRGDTAVEMELPYGTSSESINFLGCAFINNKFSIISNNTKRVNITGNQFDSKNLKGSIAIKQGIGDGSWVINPNFFINNEKNIIEAGKNNIYMSSISVSSKGVLFPQNQKAGIYSGNKNPEGNVEAEAGSIYLRTSENSHYHIYEKKKDGKTGWKPLK